MKATVDVVNRQEKVSLGAALEDLAVQAALAALEAGGWAAPAELSLCLVDDGAMAELNRRYRGKAEATDVLAFPQHEEPRPDDPPPHLGDVVISLERALAQGSSLERELAVLVTHGVLHLLGFDHGQPEEETRMQEKEMEALERLARSGHVPA